MEKIKIKSMRVERGIGYITLEDGTQCTTNKYELYHGGLMIDPDDPNLKYISYGSDIKPAFTLLEPEKVNTTISQENVPEQVEEVPKRGVGTTTGTALTFLGAVILNSPKKFTVTWETGKRIMDISRLLGLSHINISLVNGASDEYEVNSSFGSAYVEE